jgi:hypothetical protein
MATFEKFYYECWTILHVTESIERHRFTRVVACHKTTKLIVIYRTKETVALDFHNEIPIKNKSKMLYSIFS